MAFTLLCLIEGQNYLELGLVLITRPVLSYISLLSPGLATPLRCAQIQLEGIQTLGRASGGGGGDSVIGSAA